MGYVKAEIPDDEIEDFNSGVKRVGLDVSSFELSAIEDTPVPVGNIARIVTVSRKSHDIVREYDGSTGTDWTRDAVRDVETGVFGG